MRLCLTPSRIRRLTYVSAFQGTDQEEKFFNIFRSMLKTFSIHRLPFLIKKSAQMVNYCSLLRDIKTEGL